MKDSSRKAVFLWLLLLGAAAGVAAQTLSPPIAEYRGKGSGMLELRNDGDVPLAAIVEARSFTVDRDGKLVYRPLDPRISVELGAGSFILPPHQVHYVFYKVDSTRLPVWFAIINMLTRPTPAMGGLRVNVILPHLVYVSQKSKMKKEDVQVRVLPGGTGGEYRLEIDNVSEKLGRVETVRSEGFRENQTYGGFPLFPGQVRRVVLRTGLPSGRPRFRIRFEDGFQIEEPLPVSAALGPPAR